MLRLFARGAVRTTGAGACRLQGFGVAAELLSKSNDLRVTEICYMVGFTSTSYFAKCFHAQFGMLPTEFMEKYRRE